MASWQAHLIVPLVKYLIKRRLRRSPDIEEVRKVLSGASARVSRSVIASDETIGGIEGEWSRARSGERAAVMLYLHGGGYSSCTPKNYRTISNAFAKAGFEVFMPAYRLAPEHPFPCAMEDAFAVYIGLMERGIPASRLVVAGDSAGGGLALALLLKLRDAHKPLPAGTMLFSPWTDMTASGASIDANAKRCAMFDRGIIARGASVYLSGADPKHPLASPLFADLRGLPAMRIHASTDESLLDDSVRFNERARAAGVPCALRLWQGVPHAWQLMPFLPERAESIEAASEFLKGAVQGAKTAAGERPIRLVK